VSADEVSDSGNGTGQQASPRRPHRRRPGWRIAAWIVGLLIFAVIVWRIVVDRAGPGPAAEAPVPVAVATATRGTFVVYQTALGVVTPIDSVVVRSPVEGLLTALAFKDGQEVAKGAPVATVDPQPYASEISRASGQLASDQAALANAEATLQRYRALLAENSIERQRVDDQVARVAQLKAAVQTDQSPTGIRITTPIAGMASLQEVAPGNHVGPSDPKGIVRITRLAPTAVVFALPANALAPLRAALGGDARVPVEAYGSGHAALGEGHLVGVDNRVDAATGTVKLKAEFANPQHALFPGQAVTVRLPVKTLAGATLVPSAAIQHGAEGDFVYTLGKDHTVAVAPVTTGPDDGATTVVERGIAPGARIVVEGADRLRAGTRVAPREAAAGPNASA
jgi:multidrug efflux system membrane fusion protein